MGPFRSTYTSSGPFTMTSVMFAKDPCGEGGPERGGPPRAGEQVQVCSSKDGMPEPDSGAHDQGLRDQQSDGLAHRALK